MSSAIGFGEYEILLPCDCINAAFTFSRELFSREYVVQRVTNEILAVVVKENEAQWKGVARVHTGHIVISVDGIRARGLSSRQFAELWYPLVTSNDNRNISFSHRRVRFRDRKRAELEIEIQKQWMSAGPTQFSPVQNEAELQSKIRKTHTLIWEHQLTKAYEVLHSLSAGSDPTVCLLAVELEVVRVLVSNDTLYAKQAQHVANQAVAWLESLCELSSLSYSSRRQTQLVLAEALFLSALLRLGCDQRLAAIATARRCAAIYVKLHENFCTKFTKRDRLLMPYSELQTFRKRICFGMGVLHAGGAFANKTTFDWVGASLIGACDIKRGLEYLIDCSSIIEGSHCVQANWAALTLMHCSGAIRLVRQRKNQEVGDQLVSAISASRQAALQRHPKSLVFLWVEATLVNFDGDRPKLLAVELARISNDNERAHLVRFDVGYRHFLARELADAVPQYMVICKSASAPAKLRGLSSLFLAACYLLKSHEATGAKLLNSVRILLRSARRFLALRLKDNEEDLESASLHERLADYLDRSDEHLQLLPWEILYVYCHSSTTIMTATGSPDGGQHQQHLAALNQLDRLANSARTLNGETSQQSYDGVVEAELTLLRVIVLFNLRELDACDKQLQNLWIDLLPQGSRPRANSPFDRWQRQRKCPYPPAPFVTQVAWFYQLRLLLERKCSRSTLKSIENTSADTLGFLKYGKTTLQDPISSFPSTAQQLVYPYHYIYNGKVQALSKLITRLANNKIDTNCSSSPICT
ncbi:unnamed protein product [Peronospora effusa]|nr:unnamed protein product [Peronospora effusa]